MASLLALPRPGELSTAAPIPGPPEASFTSTFGSLLPPASYLHTPHGKAAYYEFPAHDPSHRVLLIHGVQTPALGMLPLTRALRTSFATAHFVLFDLWGHGLSDTPVVAHTPSLFHQLIDSLLDHLGWLSAHLVGYSFGGSLAVGYTASRTERVSSITLIAPAGLIPSAGFTDEERGYLQHKCDENAARRWVLQFLEGGELVLPQDWKERVSRGEVVAEAVREWQMREHKGHTASVVAVFRDGGVMDNDEAFVQAARTGVASLVVLGGLDDLCTKEQLSGLGFGNVEVIPDVGHGVVRERAGEVAGYIGEFWRR